MSRLDEAIQAAATELRESPLRKDADTRELLEERMDELALVRFDDLRELIAAATQHRSNVDRAIGKVERARVAARYLTDVDIRVGQLLP